jgi:hypothetical protein
VVATLQRPVHAIKSWQSSRGRRQNARLHI